MDLTARESQIREAPAGKRRGQHDHWVWQVTALSAALGVMLALAIRTEEHIRNIGLPSDRHGVSAASMTKWQKQGAKLSDDIRRLRAEVAEFRSSATDKNRTTDLLHKQYQQYRALMGYAPVQGPGLRLVLKNSPVPILPGTQPAAYLANADDLNGLVNELWAAGAEAVAVGSADGKNPQRFIVNTTIRPDGKGVSVDGVKLSVPYEILAIGNPKELRAALFMPEGIIMTRGLDQTVLKMLSVEESQHLVLPAHNNPGDPGTVDATDHGSAHGDASPQL